MMTVPPVGDLPEVGYTCSIVGRQPCCPVAKLHKTRYKGYCCYCYLCGDTTLSPMPLFAAAGTAATLKNAVGICMVSLQTIDFLNNTGRASDYMTRSTEWTLGSLVYHRASERERDRIHKPLRGVNFLFVSATHVTGNRCSRMACSAESMDSISN